MSVKEEKQYWEQAAASDNVMDNYIIDKAVTIEQCLDAILPEISSAKTGTIIEIGCGVGRLALPIAKLWDQATVIGIDISPSMIKLAKQASKAMGGQDNVSFLVGNGRTLKAADESVAAVYSMVTFQHIPNDAKEGYIREAARVLQPGGVLRFQIVEDAETGLVSYGSTREEVAAMCENAGLVIERMHHELIHPQWSWITAVKT